MNEESSSIPAASSPLAPHVEVGKTTDAMPSVLLVSWPKSPAWASTRG